MYKWLPVNVTMALNAPPSNKLMMMMIEFR